VVKYGQKTTDKEQYFVLKSLLLNPMKLKKVPLLQAKVHFEPQKLKILVEDDSISLKFISKILKIFGDNLLIARNGFEAVNLCKKINNDIILMDIQMPIMNG
jgi:PleD family two-component response regulator